MDLDNPDESDGEANDQAFDTWTPDPLEAGMTKSSSRSRRTGDITSMLITIYGSKELFVNEYRSLLSERLLALTDYNVDKEV